VLAGFDGPPIELGDAVLGFGFSVLAGLDGRSIELIEDPDPAFTPHGYASRARPP